MATCKDCIHYEVCKTEKGSTVFYREGLLSSTYNQVDKICGALFKDRSRFVELPCKVGDTVYEIVKRKVSGKWTPKIVSRVVEQIEICDGGIIGFRCGTTIWISAASAFLTREEAEQALKEKEREENA